MMNKIICAFLCVLCFRLDASAGRSFQSSGPRPGEKGKYVYTVDGTNYKHCMYCPEGAFESTKLLQEPRCTAKYDGVSNEITSYERGNKKIPVCKVGETPSCGPPPEERKSEYLVWFCEPGHSNVTYSVYFSCILIHKHTKVVTLSYYCSENLKWVMESNITNQPQSVITKKKDLVEVSNQLQKRLKKCEDKIKIQGKTRHIRLLEDDMERKQAHLDESIVKLVDATKPADASLRRRKVLARRSITEDNRQISRLMSELEEVRKELEDTYRTLALTRWELKRCESRKDVLEEAEEIYQKTIHNLVEEVRESENRVAEAERVCQQAAEKNGGK